MPDAIMIRQATLADVGIIARHRAAMFLDMGSAALAVVEGITDGEWVGALGKQQTIPLWLRLEAVRSNPFASQFEVKRLEMGLPQPYTGTVWMP